MPKTRNAFAFRGFDSSRILQRPFFKEWREEWLSVKDEWSDAELLKFFAVDYSGSLNGQVVMQQALDWFDDGLALMKKYRRRIKKRVDFLIRRRDSVANQIADADETADVANLRTCHKRTTKLAENYTAILAEIDDLSKKISNRYSEFEAEINYRERKAFGERLRQARLAAGLTQAQLGESLQLSQKAISGYEVGTREPTLSQMIRLAYKLNRSVDWFLGVHTHLFKKTQ